MAGHVDVERAPPGLVVERLDAARRREHAHVADEHVEPAELAGGTPGHGSRGGRIGKIALDVHGGARDWS